MSTELPFVEGQVDALTNTIWWGLDHRFGGQARRRESEDPNSLIAFVSGLWDSFAIRFGALGVAPFLARYFIPVENPLKWSLSLIAISIVGPVLYSIFIYTPFLDPLRRLPHLKVDPFCLPRVKRRAIGS
jgi:hypothetical protein